jgi:transcriptional regulator with XRE-family HTH domain
MLAQWIGDVVGQMHNYKISKTQLAEHMGVSREYVSMIINGHRSPDGAEGRFRIAVNELIAEKTENQ